MKIESEANWKLSLSQAEAEALRCVLYHYQGVITEKTYKAVVCYDNWKFHDMNVFVANMIDKLPEAL